MFVYIICFIYDDEELYMMYRVQILMLYISQELLILTWTEVNKISPNFHGVIFSLIEPEAVFVLETHRSLCQRL